MRGKHGVIAAGRRESAEAEATITTYQATVARLMGEAKRLRDELADERRQHLADVRVLKAQLNEGLSPELLALRSQVSELRDEVERRRRAAATMQRIHDRAFVRIADHFETFHDLTRLEAAESAAPFLGLTGEELRIAQGPGNRNPTERDVAIQRARGERR